MKTIVGNWKMNGEPGMARRLAAQVASHCAGLAAGVGVVLCPPFVLMDEVRQAIAGSKVKLGGQDCSSEERGSYTGDISAVMLKSAGCTHVIVGHSERRIYHGETGSDVRKKALCAMVSGLAPIICVGETLQERESGKAEEIVARQVRECLPNDRLPMTNDHFLLAYEPVWAIGSGKTPTAEDIRKMHAHIQSVVPGASVLYGGSVNGQNAAVILAIVGVAGVLVGGASLKAEEFCKIIGMIG